jgi:hypothetical protein
MDREIWSDIILSLNNLELNKENYRDPLVKIVGKDDYYSEAERIELTEIRWEDINILYEGETPISPSEETSNINVREDWSRFIFEECAWYKSFHYSLSDWGIHIKEQCWLEIARKFFRHKQFPNFLECIKSAFFFVFLHELFHYINDLAAARMEIITRNPSFYLNYSNNVYAKTFLSSDCIEEALANRYLYGRRDTRLSFNYLYQILKAEPPGYCDFDSYSGPNFRKGRRVLMNQVLSCSIHPGRLEPIEQVVELVRPGDYSRGHRVPIWLHRTHGARERILIK